MHRSVINKIKIRGAKAYDSVNTGLQTEFNNREVEG